MQELRSALALRRLSPSRWNTETRLDAAGEAIVRFLERPVHPPPRKWLASASIYHIFCRDSRRRRREKIVSLEGADIEIPYFDTHAIDADARNAWRRPLPSSIARTRIHKLPLDSSFVARARASARWAIASAAGYVAMGRAGCEPGVDRVECASTEGRAARWFREYEGDRCAFEFTKTAARVAPHEMHPKPATGAAKSAARWDIARADSFATLALSAMIDPREAPPAAARKRN
jgi:hypothetical protein